MIEEPIYSTLIQLKSLKKYLAPYQRKPAVFYQRFPHDKDILWDNTITYPRMVYRLDRRRGAGGVTAGVLIVDLFCDQESTTPPEDISDEMVKEFTGTFFTQEEQVYLTIWNKTVSFEGTESRDRSQYREHKISGQTIQFDLVPLPYTQYGGHSPLWATGQFVKEKLPHCTVIGIDRLPKVFFPAADKPVLFISHIDTSNVRTAYAMAWQRASLGLHMFPAAQEKTNQYLMTLEHTLSLEREAVMEDGSPFLIKEIRLQTNADPFTQGQIVIEGEYGMLRTEPEYPRLMHANMDIKE